MSTSLEMDFWFRSKINENSDAMKYHMFVGINNICFYRPALVASIQTKNIWPHNQTPSWNVTKCFPLVYIVFIISIPKPKSQSDHNMCKSKYSMQKHCLLAVAPQRSITDTAQH